MPKQFFQQFVLPPYNILHLLIIQHYEYFLTTKFNVIYIYINLNFYQITNGFRMDYEYYNYNIKKIKFKLFNLKINI